MPLRGQGAIVEDLIDRFRDHLATGSKPTSDREGAQARHVQPQASLFLRLLPVGPEEEVHWGQPGPGDLAVCAQAHLRGNQAIRVQVG